jgi:hypothetical protein
VGKTTQQCQDFPTGKDLTILTSLKKCRIFKYLKWRQNSVNMLKIYGSVLTMNSLVFYHKTNVLASLSSFSMYIELGIDTNLFHYLFP